MAQPVQALCLRRVILQEEQLIRMGKWYVGCMSNMPLPLLSIK